MKKTASQKVPPQKLTTRLLETEHPPRTIIRDTDVHGLLVEFGQHPFVSFKIQADLRRDGKVETVRMKLGVFPEMSVATARAQAMPLLAQIKTGVDPRKARSPEAINGVKPWTVADGFVEYAKYLKAQRSFPSIRDQEKMFPYLFGPNDPQYPAAYSTMTRSEVGLRTHARKRGEELPPPPPQQKQKAVPPELDDWRPLQLRSLTKEFVRARHAHISKKHGEVIANKVMRMLRSWINHAANSQSIEYPKNPVGAVDWNTELARNRSIRREELVDWYNRLQTIYNPLRKIMHELGLFLGVRPSMLVRIQVSWIDFERCVIQFPAEVMKVTRKKKKGAPQPVVPFDLPLSTYAITLLQEAIQLKTMMSPAANDFLFPTIDKHGVISATVSWKERKGIPQETGHILRHTYSNMARSAGVGDNNVELLMAHVVPGIKGRYLDQPALFQMLLAEQEKVSNFILSIIRPAIAKKYEARAAATPAAVLNIGSTQSPKGSATEGLLDRRALAKLLRADSADIARMVKLGVPTVPMFGAERFEYQAVLDWMKKQPPVRKTLPSIAESVEPARPIMKAKGLAKRAGLV